METPRVGLTVANNHNEAYLTTSYDRGSHVQSTNRHSDHKMRLWNIDFVKAAVFCTSCHSDCVAASQRKDLSELT